jgi:CHAT domain-containing protein
VEGLSGLARDVISAGSRSVLATLWSIDDAETPPLIMDFFDHEMDEPGWRSRSLASAKRAAIERGDGYSEWAGLLLWDGSH